MTQITHEELQKIVQTVPMLSASANRLLQLATQPDHDLIEIIKLVKTDANLTARVLKVVNSAAFSLVSRVTSIDRAVSYLGERIVVGLALGDCAGKVFNKDLAGYESNGGSLWKHDLRTAIAAREVVVESGVDISPELAFTAGLLHDIGKALISDYLQGSVPDAVAMVSAEDNIGYLSAEENLVGFDHTLAGYELAKAWELPDELTEAIRHHHEPQNAAEEFRPLVYAVHLGDNIAMLGGFGTGSDSMRYKLDSNYKDYIKISPKTLSKIMLAVDMEFEKLEGSMNATGEQN
jgi:putative nucleotidyltransferase with HDIG domain